MRGYRRNITRSALLSTSAVALLAASFVPATAWAQDDNEEVVEEVVVTGSRIRRAGFDTQTPGVQLDSADIDERGFTDIGAALNELPAFGAPGNSPSGGQPNSAVGQTTANLYSLGSQRTLTLVNGRRVVSSNAPSLGNLTAGLQVDLNAFPTGLVDRVETVSIGGAPVYGSDAIAGTVNIILKKDYEGMQIDGQWGKTEHGIATNRRIRGLIGGNFADDRGNAVVSVEYSNEDGFIREDNRFDSDHSFQTCSGTPSAGKFGRCMFDDIRVQFATHAGLPSVGTNVPLGSSYVQDANGGRLHFGDDGKLIPFDGGVAHGVIFASGGDGIDLDVLANGKTPIERTIINANSTYQISDNVSAFIETSFYNANATSVARQAGWLTGFFAGGVNDTPAFSVDNPYLDSDARTIIMDNNVREGLAADTDFYVSRDMRDVLIGDNKSQLNMYRIVAGLEGDFEMADRTWNWDVSYNYGRTEVATQIQHINQEAFGHSLKAVIDPASGEIVCDVTLNPIAGANNDIKVWEPNQISGACVPLNLFGVGNMSEASRSYVTGTGTTHSALQQQVFSANLSGSVMDTDAGPVGVAMGFEHRREFSSFGVDDMLARGLGRGSPTGPGGGTFETYEAYVETLIPLVSAGEGIPVLNMIFDTASIEAAVRNVDHSNAGGAITWTAGGRFSPAIPFLQDDLVLRGNFTHSIRSPAMVELFTPVSRVRGFINDPCDSVNVTNVASRASTCAAHAASIGATYDPATFITNARNGSVFGTTGGNAGLANEVADSWSVGGVYSPSFVPGLTISWDWIDIAISDAISNLTGTTLAQSCYDDDVYGNAFCDGLTRNSDDFQYPLYGAFEAGFLNAGFLNYTGWDLQARMAVEVADIMFLDDVPGNFSMNLNWSHMKSLSTQATLSASVNPQAGEIGRSHDKFAMTYRYSLDGFAMSWNTRYIGSAVFDNQDGPTSRDVTGVSSWINHNATVSYAINEDITARLVVNNIFDQAPPLYTSSGVYDLLGRAYRIGVTANF
jgi:iron complex outermembrane receptor protein